MPLYYYYDWTYMLLLPVMILSIWAQHQVNSNYRKYSEVMSRRGYTGADIARQLLRANGIMDVDVQMTGGYLTDHYDPRKKVLRLSQNIYGSSSIAAIAVAAHETGHAVQHNQGYVPLSLRSAIVPVASFGSRAAIPLFIIGMIFASPTSDLGYLLMQVGILMFTAAVIFQLVTLPVEFNASNRAIVMLQENNYLDENEIKPARKVLNAAALTYVAAAATAIVQLLRLVLLSNNRRNRR